MGYELLRPFVGKQVRVFLCNNSVLSGELWKLSGKNVHLRKAGTSGLEAIINLDHMVSTTKV